MVDCTIHDDLDAMYAAVAELWGIDVDEVVGAELTVKIIDDNVVVLDSRMCGDAIETTIENEINNWEM
ncbi:hypothetical protein OAV22_02070 [Flavobacteriaceae bacterium]|nr:hypothetical protein [Flavobacteriaceae bacterium]